MLVYGTLLLMITAACGGKHNETANDTLAVPHEEFHADNDIAMTVRSIADAIRVGEPLDSTDYDFEGVLTDGQGHPLYSDPQGTPGVWQVEVTSSTSAVIRNIWLGDLLPVDLERYLLQSMSLTEGDRVEVSEDPASDSQLSVYNFSGGYLCIETRTANTVGGQQGALMSIRASKQAPI